METAYSALVGNGYIGPKRRVVLETDGQTVLKPEDECWNDLMQANAHANIFHHPAWAQVIADCYGYRSLVIAIRDSDGRLAARLPMMEVNSYLTGRRWVSLPFTDHCAPLCRDEAALQQLTDRLVAWPRNGRMPRLTVRWSLPARPALQSHSQHVLHTINLGSDCEAVARRFHPTHRRNIRVAERRGVRIERGNKPEHLREFYRLHVATRRRQGVPVQPRRFFQLLGSNVLAQGLGFVSLAYKNGRCLAAAVFLHWQQTLTYKYGAARVDSLGLRPNNLLFWDAIRWGCEHGYVLFDLGRTDLANVGLRKFKSGWGSEEIPLVYSTLSSTPLRPKASRLASVMGFVIRKSPQWVCRAAGELLYRHFG